MKREILFGGGFSVGGDSLRIDSVVRFFKGLEGRRFAGFTLSSCFIRDLRKPERKNLAAAGHKCGIDSNMDAWQVQALGR